VASIYGGRSQMIVIIFSAIFHWSSLDDGLSRSLFKQLSLKTISIRADQLNSVLESFVLI
jgi:hypothetical protein